MYHSYYYRYAPRFPYIPQSGFKSFNPPFHLEDYTLYCPLFQSLNEKQIEQLLNSYYTPLYIEEQMEMVDNGTSECEDYVDLTSALLVDLQNDIFSFAVLDAKTGEVLQEIELNEENMNKTIGNLVPASILGANVILSC